MLQIGKDIRFSLSASGNYAGKPHRGLASNDPIFFN